MITQVCPTCHEFFSVRSWRRSSLVLLFGVSLAWVRAQQPPLRNGDTIQQAFARSAALFAANDTEQAERVLFAANRSRPATVLWNVESAHVLVRMASDAAARGRSALGLQLARRALFFLDEAVARATPRETGVAASAQELRDSSTKGIWVIWEEPRRGTVRRLCWIQTLAPLRKRSDV